MRTILSILFIILSCNYVHAQLKVGATVSRNSFFIKSSMPIYFETKAKTSFLFGISTDLRVSKKFSAEVIFAHSTKSYDQTNLINSNSSSKISFFNSQYLGKYHLHDKLKIIGGPEFNFTFGEKGNTIFYVNNTFYPQYDMGMIAGLEWSPHPRVSIIAKYHWQLVNPIIHTTFSADSPETFNTVDLEGWWRGFSIGVSMYPYINDDFFGDKEVISTY